MKISFSSLDLGRVVDLNVSLSCIIINFSYTLFMSTSHTIFRLDVLMKFLLSSKFPSPKSPRINGKSAQFRGLVAPASSSGPAKYKVLGLFDGVEADSVFLTVSAANAFVRFPEPKSGRLHQHPSLGGKPVKVLAASSTQYLVEYDLPNGARGQTLVLAKYVLLDGATKLTWSWDGASSSTTTLGTFVQSLQEGAVYRVNMGSGVEEHIRSSRVSVLIA